MSSKARALFKRLRSKANEERQKERNENPEESQILKVETLPMSFNTNKFLNNEKEIDPLDYFKTEHIVIKEANMEEYSIANIRKEIAEEEKKDKEAENITKIGGMFGVRGFKVNFEEMMMARSKVKRDSQQKSLSVGTRTKNVEKPTYEYVKKNYRNKEDNLYIKLILAKNKYSLGNNSRIYSEILKKIDELKGLQDLPKDLSKELDGIINDIQLPKHLVLCSDVQFVSDDEDDSDSIGQSISLEQVIKKMNLKADM